MYFVTLTRKCFNMRKILFCVSPDVILIVYSPPKSPYAFLRVYKFEYSQERKLKQLNTVVILYETCGKIYSFLIIYLSNCSVEFDITISKIKSHTNLIQVTYIETT